MPKFRNNIEGPSYPLELTLRDTVRVAHDDAASIRLTPAGIHVENQFFMPFDEIDVTVTKGWGDKGITAETLRDLHTLVFGLRGKALALQVPPQEEAFFTPIEGSDFSTYTRSPKIQTTPIGHSANVFSFSLVDEFAPFRVTMTGTLAFTDDGSLRPGETVIRAVYHYIRGDQLNCLGVLDEAGKRIKIYADYDGNDGHGDLLPKFSTKLS